MKHNQLKSLKSAEALYSALQQHNTRFPNGDPSLWNVQQEALQGLQSDLPEAMAEGDLSLYTKMFTSSGKTRTYLKFIELMTQQYGRPPRTLVVSETKEGVGYFKEEAQKFTPELANDIGLYYAHAKELHRPITSTTYQSFLRRTQDGAFRPEEIELIIFDEVDLAITDARLAASDAYKNAVIIGASSTDQYSSDRHVKNHFRQFYSLDHEQAINKGVITPFRNILVPSDSFLENVDIEGKDYNPEQLERAVNIEARNLAAINMYKSYVCEYTGKSFLGQQAFASCTSVQHAKDFAALGNKQINRLLPKGKTFCAPVWGDMPKGERKDTFEAYEAGEILALSFSDLLIRGYNHQPASVLLNLRPSKSSTVVGQRGGRVLRRDENNPDKMAYIVDLVDQVSDPDKFPLLYGEYVNGAAFGTIFEKEPEYTSLIPKPRGKRQTVSTSVISSVKDVSDFLDERQETRKSLRRGIIKDRVIPAVREYMNSHNIETIVQLYQKIKHDLPSEDLLSLTDYRPTMERFQRIVTGTTSGWDTRTGEATHEAQALSNLFACDIQHIFGEPPEELRQAKASDLPYNPKQHKRFVDFMKQAGYTSMVQLKSDCILGSCSLSGLGDLARGQKLPYSKMDGVFTDIAHEVATLFNTTPEELFDFDPLNPDLEQPNTLHIDQEHIDHYEDSRDEMECDDSYDLDQELSTLWVKKAKRGGRTIEALTSSMPVSTPDFDYEFFQEAFSDTLKGLTKREQLVIRERHFNDCTLDECGAMLDVSRERVRQIENKALRKLRHPSRSDHLTTFFDDFSCELYVERNKVKTTPKSDDAFLKRLKKVVSHFEAAVCNAAQSSGDGYKHQLQRAFNSLSSSLKDTSYNSWGLDDRARNYKHLMESHARDPEKMKAAIDYVVYEI